MDNSSAGYWNDDVEAIFDSIEGSSDVENTFSGKEVIPDGVEANGVKANGAKSRFDCLKNKSDGVDCRYDSLDMTSDDADGIYASVESERESTERTSDVEGRWDVVDSMEGKLNANKGKFNNVECLCERDFDNINCAVGKGNKSKVVKGKDDTWDMEKCDAEKDNICAVVENTDGDKWEVETISLIALADMSNAKSLSSNNLDDMVLPSKAFPAISKFSSTSVLIFPFTFLSKSSSFINSKGSSSPNLSSTWHWNLSPWPFKQAVLVWIVSILET